MKKNIILGIAFLTIMITSMSSVFKTDKSDLSLNKLVQEANANGSEWSGVRNWLKADRKQSENEQDCVYYESYKRSYSVGTTCSYTEEYGKPVKGTEVICDATGRGCVSLDCN